MIGETVASLAALVGGRVVGDGSRRIVSLGDLRRAGPEHVAFLRDSKYRELAQKTTAGALITAEEIDCSAAQILVDDVGVAYAKIAMRLHPTPKASEHRIHPTAVVDPEARLEAPVEVGPHVVIGKARIGAGSVLMAGASVADGCVLGREVVLYPKVTVYERTEIGDRVIVHANAVLGSDGFGYARQGAEWIKLPQLGGLAIAEDVEIGAGTAVDRGALDATRIGPRTKIDNLCHIAHNCQIGADTVFAAGTMVAGSTVIGNRVTLAGCVSIAGHLRIADDVRIGGASVILTDVPEAGDYMGHPWMEKRRHLRTMRAIRELLDLREDVAQLKGRRQRAEPGD